MQRLMAAAESGKTGDITDSLDIGANVNSVNQVGHLNYNRWFVYDVKGYSLSHNSVMFPRTV